MIFDKIKNLDKYISYIPEIEYVLEFLARCKDEPPKVGSSEIGERCFANYMEYETAPGEKPFENHGRYIDLMVLLSGEELLQFAPASTLKKTVDKMESDDYCLLKGKSVGERRLDGENFAIIYPGEAHRSGISTGKNREVKKIVFKIEA